MRHRLPLGRWAARRTRHRSRGQSLVELALLLPVMMMLFAGALDLGRVFYSQITIENAAKEGALEAARNPTSFDNTKPCDKDTNRILCLVLNEAKGSLYEITPSDVTVREWPVPEGEPSTAQSCGGSGGKSTFSTDTDSWVWASR